MTSRSTSMCRSSASSGGAGFCRLWLCWSYAGHQSTDLQILDPNLPQVLPVAAGALERRPHRRQDVLFDHDPAVVAGARELPQYCRKIDRSPAELAEQAVPQGVLIVPLF